MQVALSFSQCTVPFLKCNVIHFLPVTQKPTSQLCNKQQSDEHDNFRKKLNVFFKDKLGENGYSDVVVHKSDIFEVTIIAARPTQILGEKRRRIRKLSAIVNTRWGREYGKVKLYNMGMNMIFIEQ